MSNKKSAAEMTKTILVELAFSIVPPESTFVVFVTEPHEEDKTLTLTHSGASISLRDAVNLLEAWVASAKIRLADVAIAAAQSAGAPLGQATPEDNVPKVDDP